MQNTLLLLANLEANDNLQSNSKFQDQTDALTPQDSEGSLVKHEMPKEIL